MNINGRHVFITGASKRVGRAIADRLLDFDIRLTAHYRSSRVKLDELEPRR